MTTKQQKAKFVEAKLQGASDTKAALIAKPDIKPSSAPNVGMRLSRDVDVQSALQNALEKHGVTIDSSAQIIGEAYQAIKQNQFTGEINVDHTTRLSAVRLAGELLGIRGRAIEPPKTPNNDPATAKELAEAIRNGDEVRVTQAVWGKKDDR